MQKPQLRGRRHHHVAPVRALSAVSDDVDALSGQLPLVDGKLQGTGKVGDGVAPDEAASLARTAALNALAAVASVAGGLDAVTRIVKVTCFVASAPGFTGQAQVANGASELLIEVLGDAGRHARSAVGMAVLPLDSPVEVELIAEVG